MEGPRVLSPSALVRRGAALGAWNSLEPPPRFRLEEVTLRAGAGEPHPRPWCGGSDRTAPAAARGASSRSEPGHSGPAVRSPFGLVCSGLLARGSALPCTHAGGCVAARCTLEGAVYLALYISTGEARHPMSTEGGFLLYSRPPTSLGDQTDFGLAAVPCRDRTCPCIAASGKGLPLRQRAR